MHSILRSSDPRSTVNAANLPKTCGACHQGVAEAKFTIGPMHVQTNGGPNHPVVKWIRWTYWVLIPMTLGFMLLHNLLDFLREADSTPAAPRNRRDESLRMNRSFRIAHWGIMASFPTLVYHRICLEVSGELVVAVRCCSGRPDSDCAADCIAPPPSSCSPPRFYHLIHLALKKRDRFFLWAMIPTIKDATDMLQVFSYNLGLTKQKPNFAKFNYAEKMEYWAFMWGTFVMAVSGFLLWFNNFTLRYFPKWVTDAATAVHYYEALLATFSILIWHFYMVIFDPHGLSHGYRLASTAKFQPTITAIPGRSISAHWNAPTWSSCPQSLRITTTSRELPTEPLAPRRS